MEVSTKPPIKDNIEIEKHEEIAPLIDMDTPNTTTKKVDCTFMNCPSCSSAYSDEQVPRTLRCGHSLCTPCSQQFITGQKTCPECQQNQPVKSKAKNLPINYPLLRLSRSIVGKEFDKDHLSPPVFSVSNNDTNDSKDVMSCAIHGSPVSLFCCDCSLWVCQDCLVVDHPLLPRGTCRVIGLKEAINSIKREFNDSSNHTLKDIESIERSFEFDMAIHEFCLRHCPNDKRSHKYLVQQLEPKLEELRKTNKSVVEGLKERLREIKASADKTKASSDMVSPEALTASAKELLEIKPETKDETKASSDMMSPEALTASSKELLQIKPETKDETKASSDMMSPEALTASSEELIQIKAETKDGTKASSDMMSPEALTASSKELIQINVETMDETKVSSDIMSPEVLTTSSKELLEMKVGTKDETIASADMMSLEALTASSEELLEIKAETNDETKALSDMMSPEALTASAKELLEIKAEANDESKGSSDIMLPEALTASSEEIIIKAETKDDSEASTDKRNSSTDITLPEALTASSKKLLEIKAETKNIITDEQEALRKPALRIMLEHFKLDLRLVVEGIKPVYAIMEGEGDEDSKWAPITIRENRLVLYSLHPGIPPKEGVTIPFDYVKRLIPKDETRIFFEVGTAEEEFGRFYVRLLEDSPWAEQFRLMCSGEKGVSYKGTCFYNIDEKEGIIKGGDYEKNNGTGGRPIITKLDEEDLEGLEENITGALVIDGFSTRFLFRLHNANTYVEGVFGNVIAGVNILKSLSKVQPISKSLIRDCGLVIPMDYCKCNGGTCHACYSG